MFYRQMRKQLKDKTGLNIYHLFSYV